MPDVDELFAPLSAAIFLREYLDRKPLYLGGRDPTRHAALFDTVDPDRILFEHGERMADALTAIAGDAELSPPRAAGHGLRAWADQQYQRGATLLFTGIGRFVPALAALQRALEELLRGPVNANLYITPPHSQGFRPHFDPHDVIVLPVSGHKQWHLYGSWVPLPTKALRAAVDPSRIGAPRLSPTLSPGDLLYLPRGVVHEAHAQASPTIHLTFGILPPTWGEVLEEALRHAGLRAEDLRRSVAASPEVPDSLGPLLRALEALGGRPEEARERLQARFVRELPQLPRARFDVAPAVSGPPLTLDTPVVRAPGVVVQVVSAGPQVRLVFPGISEADHAVELAEARFVEPAFRLLAEVRGPFTARMLPGELADDARCALVERWLRAGIVQQQR